MSTLEPDVKIQDIKGPALATSLNLIQEDSCISWDTFKTETDALEPEVIERDISCDERAKRGADEAQETANEPQLLLNDTSTDPLRNNDDLLVWHMTEFVCTSRGSTNVVLIPILNKQTPYGLEANPAPVSVTVVERTPVVKGKALEMSRAFQGKLSN